MFLRRKFLRVIDYFALLGQTRRPSLDPEKLKEKYFALARERPADAELNEAFRVLSDPRLRLRHLLQLAGADLGPGRDVPPELADLFWDSGTLLREIDRWLLKNAEAQSDLSRALLRGEKAKLETRVKALEEELGSIYERQVDQLSTLQVSDPVSPNEIKDMVERHDSLSYLNRLREQAREKSFRLRHA